MSLKRVRCEVLKVEWVNADKHNKTLVQPLTATVGPPDDPVEVRFPHRTEPGDIVWIMQ